MRERCRIDRDSANSLKLLQFDDSFESDTIPFIGCLFLQRRWHSGGGHHVSTGGGQDATTVVLCDVQHTNVRVCAPGGAAVPQPGTEYLQVQYLHVAAHAHAHHCLPGRARTLKEDEPVLVSQVSVTLVSTGHDMMYTPW